LWIALDDMAELSTFVIPITMAPFLSVALLCITLLGVCCGVIKGLVPVSWVCQPGEALYWMSWLESIPLIGFMGVLVGDKARQELVSSGFRSLHDCERLCPVRSGQGREVSQHVEALECCRTGIAHLEGPWHDRLLPLEVAGVLERLHLHAARLYLGHGAKQRGREHYCYASNVALDFGKDREQPDVCPLSHSGAPWRDAIAALAPCSTFFKQLAGGGHFGLAMSAADELILLRGIVALELLSACEGSPPLCADAERDKLQLIQLGKRDAAVRELLQARGLMCQGHCTFARGTSITGSGEERSQKHHDPSRHTMALPS